METRLPIKERSRSHLIPIYGVVVEFVLTDSIDGSIRKRLKKLETDTHGIGDCDGMVCDNGSYIVLLLNSNGFTAGVVAHELLHVTLRIMEYIGENPSKRHHEPHAYLIGYLMDLLWNDLAHWGIHSLKSGVKR